MRPAWNIVEFRGREGLLRLEADWKRLLATMPDPAAHHTYESHLAYFDHLSNPGGRYTCLARKPRCELCLINDLCRWPEKTV